MHSCQSCSRRISTSTTRLLLPNTVVHHPRITRIPFFAAVAFDILSDILPQSLPYRRDETKQPFDRNDFHNSPFPLGTACFSMGLVSRLVSRLVPPRLLHTCLGPSHYYQARPRVLSLSLACCRLFTRNGYGSTNTAFSRCRDTCDRQPLRAVRLALGPTSLTRAAPFGYCQHQRTFASIAHSSMPTVPVLLIMGTFLLWFYVVEDALKLIYTFLNPCWLSNV